MEADFSWIYLIIFLMVPLARILPRVLKKFKSGGIESQEISERQYGSDFGRFEKQSDEQFESNRLLNTRNLQNLQNLKPKTCLFWGNCTEE